jgi:membrane-bound inhibitor of C-type lysozyme
MVLRKTVLLALCVVATLLARYGLAEAGQTQVWACGAGPETLYVTPVMTEAATVILVRGEETATAIQRRAASGVRYEAPFGVEFWEKGKEATLRWPQDTRTACRHQGPLGE